MRGEMGKIASNGFIHAAINEKKQAMPMDGCFSSHPLYTCIRLKIIDLCYFS